MSLNDVITARNHCVNSMYSSLTNTATSYSCHSKMFQVQSKLTMVEDTANEQFTY